MEKVAQPLGPAESFKQGLGIVPVFRVEAGKLPIHDPTHSPTSCSIWQIVQGDEYVAGVQVRMGKDHLVALAARIVRISEDATESLLGCKGSYGTAAMDTVVFNGSPKTVSYC